MGNLVEFKKRNDEDVTLLCVNCFHGVNPPPEWLEEGDLSILACPACGSSGHIEPMYRKAREAVEAFRELYEDNQNWVNEAARMLKETNDRDSVLFDFIKKTAALASQMINDPVIVERIGLKALGNYHHMVQKVVGLIKSEIGLVKPGSDSQTNVIDIGVTANGGEVK